MYGSDVGMPPSTIVKAIEASGVDKASK